MRLQTGHDQPSYSPIPVAKGRAFIARFHHEPSHRFFWHYHPEWELTWTSGGNGLRHVGRSIEPFKAGELVLLGGFLPHTWVSDPKHPEEAECTVIQFLPQLWGEAFFQLPEARSLRALFDQAVRGLCFTGPRVAEVGAKMTALADAPPTLGAFARLLEIFAILLELPVRSLDAGTAASIAGPNPGLRGLLEWIEGRVTGPLTQEETAAQVRMAPPSFSRWFKRQMGCTFQEYVNELRVARACSMLAHAGTSITDACYQSGFSTLSNFNRRFHQITGLSPREFRSQALAGAQPVPRK